MSKMSDLILSMQEMAHDMGDDFGEHSTTITTIAEHFEVPEDMVIAALDQLPDYDLDYDDSMDGDFDSAMASAGFGTDEDYGSFSDDY